MWGRRSPARRHRRHHVDPDPGARQCPCRRLGQPTYQIANDGTSGPVPARRDPDQCQWRQHHHPGLLSGSGVTAANFGPLAPGASTGSYTVTVAGAGSLSGQALHIANNFGNVPEQTINITGAAYALASPTVTSSLSPQFNFGVVIAGPDLYRPADDHEYASGEQRGLSGRSQRQLRNVDELPADHQ